MDNQVTIQECRAMYFESRAVVFRLCPKKRLSALAKTWPGFRLTLYTIVMTYFFI